MGLRDIMFVAISSLLLICIVLVRCPDCVYDPSDPSTNCLLYCMINFSQPPQKRHYNQTSQDCEPLNGCPFRLVQPYYYDYTTNKCYDTVLMQTVIPSPTTDNNTGVLINVQPTNFICVYGTVEFSVAVKNSFCACQLFWTNSGRSTSTGLLYKCDVVQTNFSMVFQNITYVNGVAVKYNDFTPDQAKAMLQSALSVQAKFTSSQDSSSQVSVQFLLESLTQEPIIEPQFIPYMVIVCLAFTLLMGITIYEYWSSRIKITKSGLERRLEQILNQ